MRERQERIALLSRMNRGRAETPSFLEGLSKILGEPVQSDALVSLPTTDTLIQAFRAGYRTTLEGRAFCYRRFFPDQEKNLVLRLADRMAERLSDEPALLLTKMSEYCGAVRVGVSVLLLHASLVIRLDGDSLSVLSADHTQGLLIDFNFDSEDETFEAAIWGDRWPLSVLDHDRDTGG